MNSIETFDDLEEKCIFCKISNGSSDTPFSSFIGVESVKNEIIFEDEFFFIVPDIGPFIEGHFLIIAKGHIPSMSFLTDAKIERLMQIKSILKKKLKSNYGELFFFEHGAKSFSRGAGSCIDHAHLHVMPSKINILPFILKDFIFYREKENYLKKINGQFEYLYFEDSNENILISRLCDSDEPITTQYLRKIIASSLNIGYFWNWRDHIKFPKVLNTKEKIEKAWNNLSNSLLDNS